MNLFSLSLLAIATTYIKLSFGVHAWDGEEYAAHRTTGIVHAWNRIFALSITKLQLLSPQSLIYL